MNSSRIRALGLGSAFTAMEGDLGSLSYNPATFNLYAESRKLRFSLFISPIVPLFIQNNGQRFFGDRVVSSSKITMAALSSIFKGINVTMRAIDVGVLFGEPIFKNPALKAPSSRPHVTELYQHQYNSLYFRLKLGEQVTLGASVHLTYDDEESGGRLSDLGANYGVMMQPNKYLRVGVSLLVDPEKIRNYRLFLEEFKSDAVNLGVTFLAPWRMQMNLDIRNAAVGPDGAREKFLTGIEKQFTHVALRCGAQYDSRESRFTYSAGVGLFDLNALFARNNKYAHAKYALNYAIIRKFFQGIVYNVHGVHLEARI